MKEVIKKIMRFLKDHYLSEKYIKAEKPFLFKVAKQAIKGIGNEFQFPVYIDSQSEIGNHNYIGINTAITKAKIGNYCSIAPNVSIGLGEHSLNSISTSHLFYEMSYDFLTAQSCEIGHDVWIGVDSIILRGVKIGNGAVIGANSVVTKDIPDFAIAVGSPAKVIKFRFTKDDAKEIISSNWWLTQDLQMAKQILKNLEIKLKRSDLIT